MAHTILFHTEGKEVQAFITDYGKSNFFTIQLKINELNDDVTLFFKSKEEVKSVLDQLNQCYEELT
jgi:predicted DNA-binding ArsR family transcriptional regulator